MSRNLLFLILLIHLVSIKPSVAAAKEKENGDDKPCLVIGIPS